MAVLLAETLLSVLAKISSRTKESPDFAVDDVDNFCLTPSGINVNPSPIVS